MLESIAIGTGKVLRAYSPEELEEFEQERAEAAAAHIVWEAEQAKKDGRWDQLAENLGVEKTEGGGLEYLELYEALYARIVALEKKSG